MGILNVTPDSFSDGGLYSSVPSAIAHAHRMVDEGADVIDVGGESTRPGAEEVPADEEVRRVAPVVEAVAALGVAVSVDTRKAPVARAALDAGAIAVNDVSGGVFDPEMLPLVAERGCDVVLMHMRGSPQTMDSLVGYADVVAEVGEELSRRVAAAVAAGVARERIWLDPGLGFAKSPDQSLELLARVDVLRSLGHPVLVGPSRKRFVGHVTGGDPADRLEGTAAAVAWCAMSGVEMVRVHDVGAMRRVVDMIAAIGGRA